MREIEGRKPHEKQKDPPLSARGCQSGLRSDGMESVAAPHFSSSQADRPTPSRQAHLIKPRADLRLHLATRICSGLPPLTGLLFPAGRWPWPAFQHATCRSREGCLAPRLRRDGALGFDPVFTQAAGDRPDAPTIGSCHYGHAKTPTGATKTDDSVVSNREGLSVAKHQHETLSNCGVVARFVERQVRSQAHGQR
jgi:hypothetical protein